MNDLLAHDHSELDTLLDELVARFETGDARRIFEKLDLFWARLAMHIRAEHLHLFPAILGALDSFKAAHTENRFGTIPGNAQNILAQLREDHDFFMRELAAAIKEMRRLLENNSPDESKRLSSAREKITEIRRRLERHNELEEAEVYQWAERLLDSTAQADLNARMKKELSNLPPRFDDL